jgi:hypothetical protein
VNSRVRKSTMNFLLGVFSAAAALSTSAGASVQLNPWQVIGRLPSNFKPMSVLALSNEEVLVGGCTSDVFPYPSESCTASIFKVSGADVQRVYDGPGYVEVMARSGHTVFADVGVHNPGRLNRHRMLRSSDDGRHFAEEIPVSGIEEMEQLIAVHPTEIWAVAGFALIASFDGGRSWTEMSAPGDRNPSRDRLGFEGGSVFLLGDSVYRTQDRGRSWAKVDTGGAYVPLLTDGAAGGLRGNKILFGRLLGDAIRWERNQEVPEGIKPLRLFVEGKTVRMVTTPERRIWATLMIYSSRGDGSWTSIPVDECYRPAMFDLTAEGVAYAVQPSGMVLRGVLRH